jgi:hypothetical protein
MRMAVKTKVSQTEVEKIRRDPAYFSEKLLRNKLHDYQKAVLRDSHPSTVWVAGRGAGKTVVAMVWSLWKCFTEPGYKVCYIAARMGQGRIAWDVAMGMVSGTPLFNSITELSKERIKLTNGSEIVFIPGGNPVAARGFHNLMVREGEKEKGVAVIFDEAASVGRETWAAGVSIVATAPPEKTKKFVCGSPLGTDHWFYNEYLAGLDPEEKFTQSFHTSSEACPHIAPEFLEEHRAKLSPVEYNAEIKAEFQEALNSYFSAYVDAALREYATPLRFNSSDAVEYSLGVDLSQSARIGSDFTVLVVVERYWGGTRTEFMNVGGGEVRAAIRDVAPYIRVADIRRHQYLDHAGLRAELADIVRKYPSIKKLTVETYESTQLEAICGYGRDKLNIRLNRLSPTNPLQREAFSYFHQLLRDGELELPMDGPHVKELLKELKGFAQTVTEHGNITFGAINEGGTKDDVVYALNWALWGLKKEPPRKAIAGYRR